MFSGTLEETYVVINNLPSPWYVLGMGLVALFVGLSSLYYQLLNVHYFVAPVWKKLKAASI